MARRASGDLLSDCRLDLTDKAAEVILTIDRGT